MTPKSGEEKDGKLAIIRISSLFTEEIIHSQILASSLSLY